MVSILFAELAVSYAVLNAAELARVEQDFKLLARYQMGGFIGRVKLPSLSLYRERIPEVVGLDMGEVIVQRQGNGYGELKEKRFEAWERPEGVCNGGGKARLREVWIKEEEAKRLRRELSAP